MSADKETLGVYAQKADEYAALTANSAKDPILKTFIGALPKGGRVLDLGCGPGLTSAEMARAGLEVDATDAVAEMVELARGHPGVTAWQATFDEIEGEDLYDGIWANFSLLHATKADMPRHLAALRRTLKTGGLLHVAVKLGEGEERDSLGRHYAYYSEPELSALLRDAGFSPFSSRHGTDPGLSGKREPWVAMAAHG